MAQGQEGRAISVDERPRPGRVDPDPVPESDGLVGRSGGAVVNPDDNVQGAGVDKPGIDLGGVWAALIMLWCGLVYLLLGGRILVGMLSHGNGDFAAHFALAEEAHSESPIPYSAFYLLQELVGYVAGDSQRQQLSGTLIVAAALMARGVIAAAIVTAATGRRYLPGVLIVPLALSFALPSPFGGLRYIGTFPPNVWHTATEHLELALAPLAVFSLTVWWRSRGGWRPAGLAVFALAASAAAKPSLTIPLVTTTVLIAALIRRTGAQSARSLIAQCAAIVAVPAAKVTVDAVAVVLGSATTDTAIQPFTQWAEFLAWSGGDQPMPLIMMAAFVRSFAFPLAVSAVLLTTVRGRVDLVDWLLPAWAVTTVAFTIYILLIELRPDGTPVNDGNFGWGLIAANSALFLMSAVVMVRAWSPRMSLALGVLLLHAGSGILYAQQLRDTGGQIF